MEMVIIVAIIIITSSNIKPMRSMQQGTTIVRMTIVSMSTANTR